MDDKQKTGLAEAKKSIVAEGFFQRLKEAHDSKNPGLLVKRIDDFYDSEYFCRENLTREVEDYAYNSYGWFRAVDVFRDLRIRDKNDVRNVRQKLRRLAQDKILERHPKKDATYRLIDKNLEEIKWWEATGREIEAKLPFGMERFVKLFPKNIIVVAGNQNAGKSSWVLDFIRMNMYEHNIHVYNSEVGKEELNERIQLMSDINKDDLRNRVKFYERSGEFDAVIQPNEINIIDYLEVTGGEGREFFMVGDAILKMYRALEEGLIIIMLQKNFNQILGLGGSRGLEKPRLYLTIDNNRIKIIKAKNWRGSMNPNGFEAKFKLVNGNEFHVTESLAPVVFDDSGKRVKI